MPLTPQDEDGPRMQLAEYQLMADLATDKSKREQYTRMAEEMRAVIEGARRDLRQTG